MRSFQRLDLASTDWLTNHFLAKSAFRFREIASLTIPSGARVLDLCCGPGLFMPLLLDLVGPTGHVTGVDQDPILLDAAHRHLSTQKHKNWDPRHSSLEGYVEECGRFDYVLLFNSLGYFSDPIETVRTLGTAMRAGAALLIKDFDTESLFFHPRDALAWSELMHVALSNDGDRGRVAFRNFFGRHLHTIGRRDPFGECKSWTWTQSMRHPFDEFQTRYIAGVVDCVLGQAGDRCSPSVSKYFSETYCAEGPFFDDPQSIFVETEFLTLLTVA